MYSSFAFLFPNYFRAIFAEGAINAAFIPRYASFHANGEHDAAARFADRIFHGRWRRKPCSWWQRCRPCRCWCGSWRAATIRRPAQKMLTASLARITFPYLILTVIAIQLSAMLNAIEKFWAAAAWSNLL